MQPMSPNNVDDLFARATVGLDDDDEASSGSPAGWIAIRCLHRMASKEVLDRALEYCINVDPLRRRVGACVLAQLGHSEPGFEPVFVEERFAGLMRLLEAERNGPGDPQVLNDVCVAFGHLSDARAIPALLALRSHPDADVRHGVAFGLTGHEISEAIDGLIALSDDPDDDVRDWATFGLGLLVADTPAIRAALHARLDDPCYDARNEAIEGLALRRDRTVLPVLIRELHSQVAQPLLDAATALATPELCEALLVAKERGLVIQALYAPYDLTTVWNEAWRACGCAEMTEDSHLPRERT